MLQEATMVATFGIKERVLILGASRIYSIARLRWA